MSAHPKVPAPAEVSGGSVAQKRDLYTIRFREDLGGGYQDTLWATDGNDAVRQFCGRHYDTDGELYDARIEGSIARATGAQ